MHPFLTHGEGDIPPVGVEQTVTVPFPASPPSVCVSIVLGKQHMDGWSLTVGTFVRPCLPYHPNGGESEYAFDVPIYNKVRIVCK